MKVESGHPALALTATGPAIPRTVKIIGKLPTKRRPPAVGIELCP